MTKGLFLVFALLATQILPASSRALELSELKPTVNDLAGMMPRASVAELEERLRSFRTRIGFSVAVLTLTSLEGEDLDSLGRKAFALLPLNERDLSKSILLLVARNERQVGVQTGSELKKLFPEPAASQKLKAEVSLYLDGLRPDLGIHGGVHYIFKTIQGDFRVGSITEEENLELRSRQGAGAGAIFALFFAPFLAFVAGVLWGVYATKLGAERGPRLFMGALLGGGTAKMVEILTSLVSGYGFGLWYFILGLGIALGVLGSLTEYWMAGSDWIGIPREKDGNLTRKPTDKMGI